MRPLKTKNKYQWVFALPSIWLWARLPVETVKCESDWIWEKLEVTEEARRYREDRFTDFLCFKDDESLGVDVRWFHEDGKVRRGRRERRSLVAIDGMTTGLTGSIRTARRLNGGVFSCEDELLAKRPFVSEWHAVCLFICSPPAWSTLCG